MARRQAGALRKGLITLHRVSAIDALITADWASHELAERTRQARPTEAPRDGAALRDDEDLRRTAVDDGLRRRRWSGYWGWRWSRSRRRRWSGYWGWRWSRSRCRRLPRARRRPIRRQVKAGEALAVRARRRPIRRQVSRRTIALAGVPFSVRDVAPQTAVELSHAAHRRREGPRCPSTAASRATVVTRIAYARERRRRRRVGFADPHAVAVWVDDGARAVVSGRPGRGCRAGDAGGGEELERAARERAEASGGNKGESASTLQTRAHHSPSAI